MIQLLSLLLLRAYAIGIGIILLNAISVFLFEKTLKAFIGIGKALALSIVWPLAIFSQQGRKVLFNNLKKM